MIRFFLEHRFLAQMPKDLIDLKGPQALPHTVQLLPDELHGPDRVGPDLNLLRPP